MRLLFERDLTPHPAYAAFYKWLQHVGGGVQHWPALRTCVHAAGSHRALCVAVGPGCSTKARASHVCLRTCVSAGVQGRRGAALWHARHC